MINTQTSARRAGSRVGLGALFAALVAFLLSLTGALPANAAPVTIDDGHNDIEIEAVCDPQTGDFVEYEFVIHEHPSSHHDPADVTFDILTGSRGTTATFGNSAIFPGTPAVAVSVIPSVAQDLDLGFSFEVGEDCETYEFPENGLEVLLWTSDGGTSAANAIKAYSDPSNAGSIVLDSTNPYGTAVWIDSETFHEDYEWGFRSATDDQWIEIDLWDGASLEATTQINFDVAP